MAWHYRKRNLLKELLTHKPDIMCLQASIRISAEQWTVVEEAWQAEAAS
jgi:mRNA deadenylase 3'-5' endonuclease subunit Ccr4